MEYRKLLHSKLSQDGRTANAAGPKERAVRY